MLLLCYYEGGSLLTNIRHVYLSQKIYILEYRYLVMERMSSPLSSIIPLLLNNHTTATKSNNNKVMKIPLGDIASALFNCIYEMHMLNYLFQDVKPDNFMLASANSSSSSSTKSSKKAASNNNKKNNGEKDIANRIRLLDFGLVERYSDISSSSHREDLYPTSSIVGTPTYVSCNVMGGHTPSRRDDLESLGYVICELILSLIGGNSAGGGGSVGGRKRKGATAATGANNNVLPWSNAKSDSELYQIKQQEMDKSKRSSSVLFQQLKRCGGGGGLDDIIGKYFDEVMSLEYAEKPNYDRLCDHLKKIVVTLSSSSSSLVGGGEVEDDGGGKVAAKKKSATTKGTAAAAASSPKKKPAAKKSASTAAATTTTATTTTSPRRNPSRRNKGKQPPPSSSESDSSVASENIENCKKQKVGTTTTRSRKKSSRTIATQTDDDMICIDTSSDEEVEVVEEEEGVQEMDWELVDNDDDNIAAPAAAAAAASTQKNAFLKLEVISGPQKGQEVSFGNDYPDTVVVGRDPDSASSRGLKDAAKLALTVSSSIHAKFVITSKKNLHSVRVTDMSSSSSSSSDEVTLVNGAVLASGKSRQAFVGDKITVGRSILQVKRATA